MFMMVLLAGCERRGSIFGFRQSGSLGRSDVRLNVYAGGWSVSSGMVGVPVSCYRTPEKSVMIAAQFILGWSGVGLSSTTTQPVRM
jgi:hypothetical protein